MHKDGLVSVIDRAYPGNSETLGRYIAGSRLGAISRDNVAVTFGKWGKERGIARRKEAAAAGIVGRDSRGEGTVTARLCLAFLPRTRARVG